MSVPIKTNPELRKSRLFSSMWGYVRRSMLTIMRAILVYKPLLFFLTLSRFFRSWQSAFHTISDPVWIWEGARSYPVIDICFNTYCYRICFHSSRSFRGSFFRQQKAFRRIQILRQKKAFDMAAGKDPESYEDIEYVKKSKKK